MQAVGVPVGDVVHDVYGTRHQAESGEQSEHLGHETRIFPAVAENQAEKDESVLDPLVWPHQADEQSHQELVLCRAGWSTEIALAEVATSLGKVPGNGVEAFAHGLQYPLPIDGEIESSAQHDIKGRT